MWKKITAVSVIFVILLSFFPVNSIKAYDPGYYITNYEVNIEVKENGIYVIEEIIDVYFTVSSRGIYRYILRENTMTWYVGDERYRRDYEFPITNIKVSNHDFEVDYRDYDVMICIGNPNKWLTEAQQYRINYQMHTGELGLADLGDLFYLNIISGWETTIENSSFTVRFPKEVDFSDWAITSGAIGNSSNEHMNCEILEDNLLIYCTSFSPLEPNQAITAKQALGENYFAFPTFMTEYLAVIGGSFGIFVIIALIFFRHGKDDKVVQTVEFSAPQGLNSASVGYIIDDVVQARDIISLILEWGRDGYIHIQEEEKKDLTLKKLKDITDNVGSLKLKKPDYEIKMFNQLFGGKEEVKISSLRHKFATEITTAQRGVRNDFKNDRKLYTSTSMGFQALSMFLAPLSLGLTVAIYTYSRTYRMGITLLIAGAIYMVGLIVSGILIYGLKHLRGKKINIMKVFVPMGFILFLIVGLISLFLGDSVSNFMYIAAGLAITILIVIFGIFMDKRTEYGLRVYGQVLGLKDFIKTAEADRLKVLVEENPYIFYDILPYAYAFDMTSIWAKHFKNLTVPEPVYYTGLGGNPFSPTTFTRSLNSTMGKTLNTMTSLPPSASSSGGGTFGGGGFSGGGSSGGGFGGGGGGRW